MANTKRKYEGFRLFKRNDRGGVYTVIFNHTPTRRYSSGEKDEAKTVAWACRYLEASPDAPRISSVVHPEDGYQTLRQFTEGSESGDMGNTGNSSGPHLHLAIRERDEDDVYTDIDPRDAPFWDDQWLEKELPYQ